MILNEPIALLIDLDGTLIDRVRSIISFAQLFERQFKRQFDLSPNMSGELSTSHSNIHSISRAILAADQNGSRSRREFLCGFVNICPDGAARVNVSLKRSGRKYFLTAPVQPLNLPAC